MKGWISLDLQEGVSLLVTAALLLQVQLLQLQGAGGSDTRCRFPKEWKGRWYQSGLGDVHVKQSIITNKGVCADHHRDYYLVHNKDENCYQCLLMMKRHKNIIQYKESYCVPKDSLHRICATIRVESMLHTLVREPHNAVKCPFQDAYYFDYNDNMHGFCDNPISYAKPCAGEARFHFHFKHCVHLAFLHNEDFDFDCVATWKDGSDMYMFGKWSGTSVLTRDDSYRCFMFESYGSEVYMSMSADSTCRGLRTTRDGPLVLRFTKDIYGWPQAACEFPDWINHDAWRDLSGQYRVELDAKNRGSLTFHYKKRPSAREQVRTELRCVELLGQNTTGRSFTAVSFTSATCTSQHQCVMITQKDQDVIEIKLGKLTDYATAQACLQTDKDYRDSHLLFPLTRGGVACPLRGRYQVTSGVRSCSGRLVSGCSKTQLMNIRCSVPERSSDTLDITLECLSTWRQPDKTLILVRNINYETGPIGCIKLITHSTYFEFSSEDACYGGVSPLFNAPISFAISSIPEPCSSVVDQQAEQENAVEDNTADSEEAFVDLGDPEAPELNIDSTTITPQTTTTTKKPTVHTVLDQEQDEEEEEPEYSSFYPDDLEQSEMDGNLDDNLIVETLPDEPRHHNESSNSPKGPYVHVGRSRKPKSKSTSSSSASVVRTNNNADEHSAGPESAASTVQSRSACGLLLLTVAAATFLLPSR